MAGNKPLSPTKVAQVVALKEEGLSYRQIGERLQISKSAAQEDIYYLKRLASINIKFLLVDYQKYLIVPYELLVTFVIKIPV